MAKIRSIYPEALGSDKLAKVNAEAERLYWRLMTQCDDEGRCEDHPRKLWAACFPLHEDVVPAHVDTWLDALDAVGLVIRYEAESRRYLQVTGWRQKPRWAKPSDIPPLSDGRRTNVGQASDGSRTPDGISSSREVARKRERLGAPLSTDFDAAWEHYPRKIAKQAALRAYTATRRRGTSAETLEDAARRFAAAMKAEGRTPAKILHGATFYGPDERWKDYGPPDTPAPAIEPAGLALVPDPPERCQACARLTIDCVCNIDRTVTPRFKAAMQRGP